MFLPTGDRWSTLRPVSSDEKNRSGCFWSTKSENFGYFVLQTLHDIGVVGVAKERHRPAAVRQGDDRSSGHVDGRVERS